MPHDTPGFWSVPFRHTAVLHMGTLVCPWGLVHIFSGLEVANWWIQVSHSSDKITEVQKSSGSKDFPKVCGACVYCTGAESLISQRFEERNAGETTLSSADLNAVVWEWGAQWGGEVLMARTVQANYQSDSLLSPRVHKCSTAASLYPEIFEQPTIMAQCLSLPAPSTQKEPRSCWGYPSFHD